MSWQYSNSFKTVCRVVLMTFYFQTLHISGLGYHAADLGISWGFNEAIADILPNQAIPSAQSLNPTDYLSPTIDANSTDSYIIQKAQELGNDANQIFTFVRDEIGFEAYPGSLRGARGTLWSKAGNSLDKASLLVALLRAAHIPARYAHGALSSAQASQLILSMFPAPLRLVGCPDETSKTAIPGADPTLLADSQDHYWVEVDTGSGFQAADSNFPNAVIGTPITATTSVFNEIPDNLRHKITVRLKKELTTPLSGLLGGGAQDTATVLEKQFNSVEIVGKQLSLGHFVSTSSVSAVITAVSNSYSPYLLVGENDADLSDDTVIRGQDYQEMLTNFPFGSQILTGVFLETDVIAPNGASKTYQRTLIDRIGFAARQSGASATLSADAAGAPIINENDVITINALPGLQAQEQLIPLNARVTGLQSKLAALQAQIQALPASGPYSNEQLALISQAQTLTRQLNISTNETSTIAFAAASDTALQQLEKGYLTQGYYHTPRLILAQVTKTGGSAQVSLDIQKNDLRAVPAPGQVANTNLFFEVMRGLFDSTLEGEIIAKITGQPSTAITEIFQQTGADNKLVFLSPSELSHVEKLGVSATAKARIATALSSGKSVLTPHDMVTINNQQTIGWLETDWQTGQTISVMENGTHPGVAEYAFAVSTLNSPHNLAIGAFIGSVSGFSVTQLAFTAELIGGMADGLPLAQIVKLAKAKIAATVIKKFAEEVLGIAGDYIAGGLGGTAFKCIGALSQPPAAQWNKPLPPLSDYFFDKESPVFAGACLLEVVKEISGYGAAESGLGKAMLGGMLVGMSMGLVWINYNYPVDPAVLPFLSIPLAEGIPATVPDAQAGVNLDLSPDNLFYVPVNNTSLPSVFNAKIHNTGSNADTFKLQFDQVPEGFKIETSLTEVTVPPGATAEVGVCVRPQGNLPEPTSQSFSVSASSTSNPAINANTSASFDVPEADGIAMSLQPQAISILPGANINTMLKVTATGNVPQTVAFSPEPGSGLTISALAGQTLNPGDSIDLPITLTADAGLSLGTELSGVIKAETLALTSNAQAHQSQLAFSLTVAATGAKTIADAASAVGAIGNQDLADRLNGLSQQLNALAENPGNETNKNQALASLDSIIKQLANDPILSAFIDEFTASRDALSAANTPDDIMVALNSFSGSLDNFGNTASQLRLHNFEASLSPTSLETLPGIAAEIGIRIRNTGTAASTFNLSFADLPANTTASFAQTSVTLQAGELSANIPGSLTRTASNELLPATYKVQVSVDGVPEVTRLVEGSLTVRSEFVSVASVTANPPFANPQITPPIQMFMSAKILNAVNKTRSALVSFKVKDSNGQQVFASQPVATTLTVQTDLTTVDLGAFNPGGLPEGTYTAEVTVTDNDGTAIPGGTGSGSLLLGSPVTASLSTLPDKLPPGPATVSNTLSINSQLILPPLSVLGQAPIPSANARSGVAVKDNVAYVCSANGIQIFDVTDPTQPVWLKAVGSGIHIGCKVQNNMLLTLGLPSGNAGAHILHVYSLNPDPLTPTSIGSSGDINYNLQTDLISTDSTAFVSQFSFCNFVNNRDIYIQTGDVLSIPLHTDNLLSPTSASPNLADVLFNTHGDHIPIASDVPGCAENGGDGNVWQLALADENTLLVATTTIKGTDTQTGIGKVLVVDISDPANLTVVNEVQIPGTAHVIGIAVDGDRALLLSSTGGWRDFFSTSDPNNDVLLQGNLVLSTLSLSNPRNPILLSSKEISRASRTFWQGNLTALGNDRFIYSSLGGVNDSRQILMVDISNPFDPVLGQTNIASENIGPNAFAVSGGLIYATDAAGNLLVYQLPAIPAVPITASVKIPKNTGITIDNNSFSVAPSSVIAGNGYDTLVWQENITAGSSLQLYWQSGIDNLQPGEAQHTTLGGTVDFNYQGTNGQVPLNPTLVVSEQLLALSPSSQTIQPGASTLYTLTLTNPSAVPVSYDLALQGIPANWAQLASPQLLDANEVRTIDLAITTDSFASLGSRSLIVAAQGDNGLKGAVQGELILAGTPVTNNADTNAHGVLLSLNPSQATAGRGTSAHYVLRLVNTGSAVETYRLNADLLPADFAAVFDSPELTVPPGAGNFRDVGLTITAPADTLSQDYAFSVQANYAITNAVASSAQGLLTVVNAGVNLAFQQNSVNPGETLFLTISNTGVVEDDFLLALVGPAGFISSLSDPSVHLLPGTSSTVAVTIGNVDYALAGSLSLYATATSTYDQAVQDTAESQITLAERKGLSASLNSAVVTLPSPGAQNFLINIKNTGNVEDDYRVSIGQTTGPVTAKLIDGNGNPVASVPVLRLPALADGSLSLALNLTAAGTGTVKILLASNTEASVQQELTAQLGVQAANQAPLANAGQNRNVFTDVPVTLDGSGSSDPDGDLINYRWRIILTPSGSGLNDAAIINRLSSGPVFTPDLAGIYRLELVVSDGLLDSPAATVDITAAKANVPPNALAGADQTGLVQQVVTLDGSASSDPDSGPSPLSYHWHFLGLPATSTLADQDLVPDGQNPAKAVFTPDVAGVYQLQLAVSDGAAQALDNLTVTATLANVPPVANAGADQSGQVGDLFNLTAELSHDPDQYPAPLAYQWRFVSLPGNSGLSNINIITDPQNPAKAIFTADQAGEYVLEVEVSDGEASATDHVVVKVSPALTYQNVSDLVKVTASDQQTVLNRQTRKLTSSVKLTLTNISNLDVHAPIRVQFPSLPTVVNIPGAVLDPVSGQRYLELPASTLVPGANAMVTVQFVYSSGTAVKYDGLVFGKVGR